MAFVVSCLVVVQWVACWVFVVVAVAVAFVVALAGLSNGQPTSCSVSGVSGCGGTGRR